MVLDTCDILGNFGVLRDACALTCLEGKGFSGGFFSS